MRYKLYLLAFLLFSVCIFISCSDDDIVEAKFQIETQTTSDVKINTATAHAYITQADGRVTEKGFCWSENPTPTVNDNTITASPKGETDGFSAQLHGLSPSTTYYVRGYIKNNDAIFYGNDIKFTTKELPTDGWCIIDKVYNITPTSFDVIMEIADNGGNEILEYGICYSSTNTIPDINDIKIASESTGGMRLTKTVDELIQDSEYYITPYFTTEKETVYGEVVKVKTLNFIRTLSATPGYQAAYLFGDVVMDAGSATTERGVCWAAHDMPSLSDHYMQSGAGVGQYYALIGGLSKGTKYYMRAYAKNASGTYYGDPVEFTTRTGDIFPGGNLSDFIEVENDTFDMGEPNTDNIKSEVENAFGLEPVHSVTISRDFYINKFEITNEQICTFLNVYQSTRRRDLDQALYNSSGRTYSFSISGSAPNLKYTPVSGCDRKPAANVTWGCAYNYALWLSAELGVDVRLPSEAEWEYAARGGNQSKGYTYSGSNVRAEVGVLSTGGPAIVGSLKPNELGIYDMTGNVFEYCQDAYIGRFYMDQIGQTTVDPLGTGGANSAKVIRGGSFRHESYMRVSGRGRAGNEADCGNHSGIRIVMNRLPSSL